MPSFLIVKTSALGDIIQSLPVAEYLSEKGAVDWIAEEPYCEMLRAHPAIRRVIPINTRKWRKKPFCPELREALSCLRKEKYDALFDLQGNCKSAFFTLFAKAKKKVGFSLMHAPEWPAILVTRYRYGIDPTVSAARGYLQLVQKHFRDAAPYVHTPMPLQTNEELYLDMPHPRYMVCFGSNWENKQLSFETLCAFLEKIEGHFLFIYGSGKEKVMAEKLKRHFVKRAEATGGLTVPAWQGLMRKMTAVISVDSSGLHLAAAAGVPTFSIFGPSKGSVYAPEGKQHIYYQGTCPYDQNFTKRCKLLRTCETGACMKEIDSDDLAREFKSLSGKLTHQSQCDFAMHK